MVRLPLRPCVVSDVVLEKSPLFGSDTFSGWPLQKLRKIPPLIFYSTSIILKNVWFWHREVSVRKEIHSGFVTFLKIVEEVFMLLTFVPVWSGLEASVPHLWWVSSPRRGCRHSQRIFVSFWAETFQLLLNWIFKLSKNIAKNSKEIHSEKNLCPNKLASQMKISVLEMGFLYPVVALQPAASFWLWGFMASMRWVRGCLYI